MLKQLYRGGIAIAIATLSACSKDSPVDAEVIPGETPISLMGTVTRTGDTGSETLEGYTNLYLSAKTAEGSPTDYFTDVTLMVGGEVSGVAGARHLEATAYYPLGEKEIMLFAHTGKLTNDKLTLEAGTEKRNDYLISNGTDGKGTKVSSKNGNGSDGRAKELEFRHIMTKVEVVIKVTDNTEDKPITSPEYIELKFKDGNGGNGVKVYQKGTYTLNASSSSETTATATGASPYSLKKGVNYLIPTGDILSGTKGILSYLKIDDYVATSADLQEMEIPKAKLTEGRSTDTGNDFALKPGLAYTLTFEIERLKIRSIALEKKDWEIKAGDGVWGCTPYTMSVDFTTSGYQNTGDSQISKLVLKHTPTTTRNDGGTATYQYIGGLNEDGKIDFVTLPFGSVNTEQLTVDLYTINGLLISGIKPTSYIAPNGNTPGTIGLSLGANGMNKGADGYYEVTTPLQFYNLMKNPGTDTDSEDNKKYKLINNIDLDNLSLTYEPPTFPKGAILDGNGLFILHLNQTGSGLMDVNNGTLKNIHISSGTITSTAEHTGGFCGTNNGTIEACVNEADIIAPDGKTAGGICGKNGTDGTILACLSTGNIGKGNIVGGICGANANTSANAIKGCISAGMLNKSAEVLGGICGTSEATGNTVVNTCYWLTGTARKIQQTSNELAIGNGQGSISQSADLAPEKLRSEAVTNINTAITGSDWEFKWEKNDNGTYPCVWPVPVQSPSSIKN